MKRPVLALTAAFVFLAVVTVPAYWTIGAKWPDGQVVMHLELGSLNGGTLIDGSADWGASAEVALATWNLYLDRVQFAVVRNSTAPIANPNGVSTVSWSSTFFGRSYDGHPAITGWWMTGTTMTEADIVFDNTRSWNSYTGALLRKTDGTPILDFRRYMLHESGHVLGLDHPDQHGQTVASIMNGNTGTLDNNYKLTADDITAVQSLYSFGGNGSVAFPPRNESLDFRTQLETKYRDGLHAGSTGTTVDREGDIVWTSEYYRFRVNTCSHAQASNRVMTEIDTGANLGVCGNASTGVIAFPPRNEALDFRTALEAKYRDDLQRGTSQTFVNNEGDVVWTQEYLRYRVNACSHAVAVDKVFAQIDGKGIQPVCK